MLPSPYEKVSSLIGTLQGLWEWTDTAGQVSYRVTSSLQHKRQPCSQVGLSNGAVVTNLCWCVCGWTSGRVNE